MNDILTNPWVGILSLLFGLTSLFVTSYFGIRAINLARPVAYLSSQAILARNAYLPTDIKIDWRGVHLRTLYKIDFALWNIGSAALRKSDVAGDGSIRIMPTGDNRIINAELLWPKPSKFIEFEGDDQKVSLNFTHLNRGDSIVARLLVADTSKGKAKQPEQIPVNLEFECLSPIQCHRISNLNPDPDEILPSSSILSYFYNTISSFVKMCAFATVLYGFVLIVILIAKFVFKWLNIGKLSWEGLPAEIFLILVIISGIGGGAVALLKTTLLRPIFSSKGYEILTGALDGEQNR